MWHFLFTAASENQQAERGAALLAAGLARQGVSCEQRHEQVTAALGPAEEPDQYVYIVMDEDLLESPVLRSLLDSHSRLVVNSRRPAEYLLGQVPSALISLVAVDADRAAADGGDSEISLLGGLVHTAPGIDHRALGDAIWSQSDRGFGYTARAWVKAFNRGLALAQRAVR
jgi:hypothetical protein